MRYRSEHKAEIHRQIVKEASRRVRAEGLHGAAVSTVMRDSGLTHGGFYKHFGSKDDLLVESLRDGFAEIASILARAAEQARPGQEWKAIVKTYLRPEMCDYPERGCPLPALAPELARADPAMKAQIVGELVKYRDRMLPFMPSVQPCSEQRPSAASCLLMRGPGCLRALLIFFLPALIIHRQPHEPSP